METQAELPPPLIDSCSSDTDISEIEDNQGRHISIMCMIANLCSVWRSTKAINNHIYILKL